MTRFSTLLAVLLAALLLAACAVPVAEPASDEAAVPTEEATEEVAEETTDDESTTSAEGFPLTITDGAGRELTFKERPQRIVCFYNGCLRGLGPLLPDPDVTVAWPRDELPDEFDDEAYYPGFGDAVILLDEGEDLDAEAIAAFEPNLIIAGNEDEIAVYEAIAPVFIEYDISSVDDAFETFVNYGRMIDMADEALQIAEGVRNRFEAYKTLSPNDVSFMTVGNGGGGTLWLRTRNSSECQVLEGLAQCDWPDPTGGESWSYQATPEAILNLNPDVIYMANWSGGEETTDALLESFRSDPLIAETSAEQNGRIYNVAGYDNPTGQGVVAMSKLLDIYMPLIYPDIFDGPLTDEEVQEILAEAE